LLALATAATPAPDCAAARQALPGAAACVASPNGIALAADEAAARALLNEAQVAEGRFRTIFGRDPAPFALFSYDDPAFARTAVPALRSLGFQAVLPLASPTLMERQMAEAMSRLPSAGGGGAPPRFVRRDGAVGGGEPRGENHVAHELGHQWYHAAFWPEAATPGAAAVRGAAANAPAPNAPLRALRYGSAAPDWMDEAAAMLMENDAGARAYAQKFADGRSADAARAAMLPPEIPLAELTRMTHPAMASMPAPRPGGPVQMVVTGRPTLFYPQARLFADYLADRSGEPRVLAHISQGMAAGATLDAWLAANGASHKLPVSLAAMQADWDAWLDQRFGPAPVDQ
jgi:hypothetical protein